MKIMYSYSFIFKFLLTGIFSAFTLVVIPQETSTCAENLKSAQSLFDKGQVSQVPVMLRECMKSGFKREEQLTAYKLLIQSYLFEDKLEQADSAMLTFLKRYPEYRLSPTDHSSFVFLFNSFKVKQLIQVTLHLGTNIPFLTNIGSHSLSPVPEVNSYKSEAINLFTSIEVKIPISSRFEANIEGGFLQSRFKNIEGFLGFTKINYSETIQKLEIPVSVTWNISTFGKFTPYARLGAGAAINLASTAKATSNPTDVNNYLIISGADLDRSDSRIFMDIFTLAGAGIKFKTSRGFISLDARSVFGLSNQVVRGGESAGRLADDYKYADDDFNMNNININIGYTHIFFKPSKRK